MAWSDSALPSGGTTTTKRQAYSPRPARPTRHSRRAGVYTTARIPRDCIREIAASDKEEHGTCRSAAENPEVACRMVACAAA